MSLTPRRSSQRRGRPHTQGRARQLMPLLRHTPTTAFSLGTFLVGPPLRHRLPAVGDERMPDNEPGAIRTEPEDRVGNFFGATHSSDWLLRDHLCPSFRRAAREPAHHRGVDVAWAYRIDANFLR